ncbi:MULTISPECIES: alpha/beta fold hydrolase [Mesorhizobium]|uniref:Alpha/beta hydrolase n=2 Tax=Mesorhizobium TaxID=68287 RepID=A0AB38TI39_9HYPH|nr:MULTISPECIES: alpha/beta hydrolase [Mesorhizobium]MDF3156096.1 alpha/beta hydrolase [Mesorhizobium sp. XAP10]MDF3212198.1 alpha/beta hydrolase [Mesorhizobium ciceri]MDF3248889.1 alpha/beta hydrolase [Mesorhizobium sp. XAP4]UTU54442.1 alpha/beta hydrolase [Mesorhizobium ciceri]
MAKFAKMECGYLYLTLDDTEYRIYLEQAGTGIPVLLQHTAGTDARQWRHLLEDEELTRYFRFIAWDLPYHGKSLPPLTHRYWETGYKLKMDWFLRYVLELSKALELDRPVFMGCSMGGLLATDLALYHPEHFRAAIALEPLIKSPEPGTLTDWYWHPTTSNDTRAALQHTQCSPSSPEVYRRETIWMYSQGAPSVFPGDLHYYVEEHDLTDTAKDIDTAKIDLYLLNADYDWSATVEEGRQLASMIPGSKWVHMRDMGHFPMAENPAKFREYIVPILDEIRAKSAKRTG